MGVKPLTIACVAVVLAAAAPLFASQAPPMPTSRSPIPDPRSPSAQVSSLYEFKTMTLDGKPTDLSRYRGLVSLVVNVASFCGYTPQYKGLEALHRELHGKGFNVLGFPSNDFGEQEPGSAQEIATFCRLTYDVTFPMFEKVVTHPGAKQSPIYTFLGRSGNLPAWNFSKYVIDRQGKVVAFFPSDVTPEDPQLRAAITRSLSAR